MACAGGKGDEGTGKGEVGAGEVKGRGEVFCGDSQNGGLLVLSCLCKGEPGRKDWGGKYQGRSLYGGEA